MFPEGFDCLFVCYQQYSKSYEWIAVTYFGEVWGGKRNKCVNFGCDLDHHAGCLIGTLVMTQQIMSGF